MRLDGLKLKRFYQGFQLQSIHLLPLALHNKMIHEVKAVPNEHIYKRGGQVSHVNNVKPGGLSPISDQPVIIVKNRLHQSDQHRIQNGQDQKDDDLVFDRPQ